MNNEETGGNIVELTVEDLEKCRSFWDVPEEVAFYRLADLMQSGMRKAFAYRIGDAYVGGCALSIRDEDCGHLSYFAVAPDFRNRGIGSRILDFAVSYFVELGMKRLRLHVYKDNPNAIRLYERKGFAYAFDVTPEKIAMIKPL